MVYLSLLAALVACQDKPAADTSSPPEDSATDGTTGGVGGTEPGDDTGGSSGPVDMAADQGLTVRAFDPSGATGGYSELAPDFTWQTLDGPWTLSENWTGYDSYVAVNIYNADYPVTLTSADEMLLLLEQSPLNVHYFFLSYASTESSRLDQVETAKASVEGALDLMDPELAAHWAARVHYVTDGAFDAAWLGALNQSETVEFDDGSAFYPLGAAIDRFQQVREIGYQCDPATGWADCPPEFLRFEAEYFNFESDRQDWLDGRGEVTVLRAFDHEPASDSGWTGAKVYADVEFPDAATMATYDTMVFDLTLDCADSPELVYCPAWDYLVYAYLCDEDDPATADVDESESCGTEIGRWITTYWRAGRWVHDVTPFLALLQDGGTRRVAFYTQQYYDVTLDVRLSNQGVGARPVAMEYLYSGGTFNERYNWGLEHEISADLWTAWTHPDEPMSWEITQRDDEAGWLVAENGQDQPISRGMWSRFDWEISEGTLYVCHTVTAESDEEDALAAEYTCAEDDPKTKDIDESTQCTGANHEDLETGCNGGAWRTLAPAGGAPPTSLDGLWTEIWHEDKLPITFTPPEGTTRVGITAVISGHGFGATKEGCAEFCDHQHRFTVNDAASYTKENPITSTLWGCADQVPDAGVVPNQAGTWIYWRASWCPGLEVQPWSIDITDDVAVGAENTVSYLGLFEGDVNYAPRYNSGYSSTDANVRMQSYLVYYE